MKNKKAKIKSAKAKAKIKTKAKAQDWEALVVGAHNELNNKKTTQPEVISIWNSVKDKDKEKIKQLVSSSALSKTDTLIWCGKVTGTVSDDWKSIYAEYSNRKPDGTSKCDIINSDGSTKYSVKKYDKTTQLNSPQKAEALTLLHFAIQNSSTNLTSSIKSKLESVIDAMTDQKYYYGSIKSAVKALTPWYNKLPQELSPLYSTGITPANVKEIEPLLQKEIKRQGNDIAKRMISIFTQKQKHFKASDILNNLFTKNTEIKKQFLHELLSGDTKFASPDCRADSILQITGEPSIKIQNIHDAVNAMLPELSIALNFRPSSKLVTLMRVYIGRKKDTSDFYEAIRANVLQPMEYLVEQETEMFINENVSDMIKKSIEFVTESPFIKKITEFFSNLILKLRALLKELLNKILQGSKSILNDIPKIFGLELDPNNLKVDLPKGLALDGN